MKLLEEKLQSFNGAKGDTFEEKLKNLDDQFRKIAEIMLCKGHLEFGDKKVYIRDVEFYYHEENGIMKDPIMYHSNDKKGNKDLFKPGTFHFHVSGVDITFEDAFEDAFEDDYYRASALIRGYSEDNPNGSVEGRPTYLYNLFNYLSPFEETVVKWEENDNLSTTDIKQTYRQNVPLYCKKDEKENVVILDPDYVTNGRNAFKAIDYSDKPFTFVLGGEEINIPYSNTKTKSTKKLQDTIHLWRFCRSVELKDTNKEYIK